MQNEEIRNAIRSLLKFYHDALPYHKTIKKNDNKGKKKKTDIEKWLKQSIRWPIRYLEIFIKTAQVSKEALAEAQKANANVDKEKLSKCRWGQQKTKKYLNDPKRKIFHYEHMYPVSKMRDKLIEVSNPSVYSEDQILKNIEEELKKFDIAWILKTENKTLDKKRKAHPDMLPLVVYEKANIDLLPRDGDGTI